MHYSGCNYDAFVRTCKLAGTYRKTARFVGAAWPVWLVGLFDLL